MTKAYYTQLSLTCFRQVLIELHTNHSLQGTGFYFPTVDYIFRIGIHSLYLMYEKVLAFSKKLILYTSTWEEGDFKDSFPSLYFICRRKRVGSNESHAFCIHITFEATSGQFKKQFLDNMEKYNWIRDPFHGNLPSELSPLELEQRIDISSNSSLKCKFLETPIFSF